MERVILMLASTGLAADGAGVFGGAESYGT
jgi:hypothetical protein